LDRHLGLRACRHYEEKTEIEVSLYTILQVLSVTIFERMPLIQVLTESVCENENSSNDNKLFLFS
jgi:hypothetical protein